MTAKEHSRIRLAKFITTFSVWAIPPPFQGFYCKYPLPWTQSLLPSVHIDNKTFGSFFRLGQAKSFVASCIIRPIGKFRGHERSASLKSS